LFVCGSDEHGVAISMKAKRRLHRKKSSINTTELSVNRLLTLISPLINSRTSAKIHHDTASGFTTL
jgi:methionyl-tRNA synthetase